jgi:hypothetical protein
MSIVKYHYDLFTNNDMFSWIVIENETGHAVGSHIFEDDAIEQMKFLTNGGGFDGFTPEFFVNNLFKNKTQ